MHPFWGQLSPELFEGNHVWLSLQAVTALLTFDPECAVQLHVSVQGDSKSITAWHHIQHIHAMFDLPCLEHAPRPPWPCTP